MYTDQYSPTLLDVPISFFNRAKDTTPATSTTLRRIGTTRHYRASIEAIRTEADEDRQKELKKALPAITPISLLRCRNRETPLSNRIVEQWPMLMGDIDQKDNPGKSMADLKTNLCHLHYILLCGYSVRGGLWFVVRLPDHQTPETLAAHFRYLQKLFKTKFGVTLDSTKGGNSTDLRYVSFDAETYLNDAATVMTGTYTPAAPKVAPARVMGNHRNSPKDACIDADRLEEHHGDEILSMLTGEPLTRNGQVTRLFDLTTHSAEKFYLPGKTPKASIHNYATHETYFPINAYAKKHGLSYGKAFHELADYFGYTAPVAAQNNTATAKVPIRGLAVGSIPLSAPANPVPNAIPPQVVTNFEDWNGANILRPNESEIERLVVEPCDSYPAVWDEPNPPGAVPVLRIKSFHEFQQSHPFFSQMGLPSLNRQFDHANVSTSLSKRPSRPKPGS